MGRFPDGGRPEEARCSTELNIRNFAIIDELKVTFDGGLNMISGETGAGKSIIIGAVGLLLGDRANADMIRSFEDAAVVEALFDIRGQDGLQRKDPGDGIRRRRGTRRPPRGVPFRERTGSTSTAHLASLASLAAIGESLINICGQHEHQMILNPENHTDILDEFGGLLPLRTAYRETYDRYRSLQERLRGLQELRRKREEREELLRFQIGEISQADVRAGEDAALTEEKKILANVQKLIDLAQAAYETLYGKGDSVLAEFRGAVSAVKEIRKIDTGLKLSEEEMEELYYRIEEAAFTLRDYAKTPLVRSGPSGGRRGAAGASGASETEIRRHARCRSRETGRGGRGAEEDLLAGRGDRDDLQRAIADEKERLMEAARVLSGKRHEAAAALRRSIEGEIRTLRMENARFEVVFREPPDEGRRP